MIRRITVILALATAACVSRGDFAAHASRRRPSTAALESWRFYKESIEKGDLAGAEKNLREAIAEDPEFVRAWRRLQDLQILQFRRGEAVAEAENQIQKNPRSPKGYYLLARLRDGAARKSILQKALDLDYYYGWARQGLAADAEAFSGPGSGLRYAEQAAELLPDETDPWLSVIQSLRTGDNTTRLENVVLACARSFGKEEPRFIEVLVRLLSNRGGRSYLSVFTSGDILTALPEILQNAGATRSLASAARGGGPRPGREQLEESLAFARTTKTASPELETARCLLAAELALQGGRVTEHRRELERAYELGERSPRVLRALRLARIVTKDYKNAWGVEEEFLQQFGSSLNSGPSPDRDLLSAVSTAASDSPNDPRILLAFARAAARYGWVNEAVELSAQSLQYDPSPVETQNFYKETSGFARFLTKFRRELEHESRASISLTNALDPIRAIAKETLGADAVEGSIIEDHFPIGALLVTKPGAPGLPAIFEQFGLELRLGKRMFGPVEASAIRKTAAREIVGTVLGRPYKGREVVGELSTLFTQIETNSGPFAGATLPGNVWIVLDTISESARSIEDERERMEQDARDGRGELWKSQYLPTVASRAGRLATDETFDLARRLTRRALERDPSPAAPRILEIVRLHEYGHLADAEQLLPFITQIPRAIWWLIDGGFSIRAIESRLERRAELVALCLTNDPELSLAAIVQHCERPLDSPPHSTGFSELAADFAKEMDRFSSEGELPQIRRDLPLLPQAWRLSKEQIRSVALALARREGLVEGDEFGK